MMFLTPGIMAGHDWRGLELSVMRLVGHCGWDAVQDIAGPGEKGADILAVRPQGNSKLESYLFQVKAVTRGNYVGIAAIGQALEGQAYYRSQVVVVATNGEFTGSAYKRRDELRAEGFDIRLWNGEFLVQLLAKWPAYSAKSRELREYQANIKNDILQGISSGRKRFLFVVATGLGKTVIAAKLTDRLLTGKFSRVLVLCHSVDLAQQLQADFWEELPKSVPTRVFMDGETPIPIEGVSFGLYQTLFNNLGGLDKSDFDVVIVDEAHHAMANAFLSCIDYLNPKVLIGMTATPWRGDGALIEDAFGEPIARVSLVDGMRMGYLAQVEYRMMCDNIDWGEVPKVSKNRMTIKDLNKRLFIPQRDEAVIAELCSVVEKVQKPRIAVFSPSVKHADTFAAKLTSRGLSAANVSVSDKVVRRSRLLDFAAGRILALTAVDVLNEGIDVPDINILVFLRATHSRRIFVQQLGRGLRISEGKDRVTVLDFVSDIRRIAAVIRLNQEAKSGPATPEPETVFLRQGIVSFSDTKAQTFVSAWLEDVADLDDLDDTATLKFPEEQ